MSISTHADRKRDEAKDHIADAFRCLMSAADAKENWSMEYAENLEDAILLLRKVSKML